VNGSDPERPLNKVGTLQEDMFKEHDHEQQGNPATGGSLVGYILDNNNPGTPIETPINTEKTGGSETRMKNVGLLPLIRA
jgi:hypothetical protein